MGYGCPLSGRNHREFLYFAHRCFLLLSAIAYGASGETGAELDEALLWQRPETGAKKEQHLQGIADLCAWLKSCPVLENRSSIQIPAGLELRENYRQSVMDAFGKTLQLGQGAGDLLKLTNLIAFKDQWKYKFRETQDWFYTVTPAKSTQADRSERQIPFIRQDGLYLNFRDTEEFTSVAIPFASKCHMVLAMPKRWKLRDPMSDYMYLKRALELSPWPSRMERVDLSLPTFKITNHARDIRSALYDCGVREAFDRELAQIDRITEKVLYIQSAEQQAEVEVNAEGASARAVTTIGLGATVGIVAVPPVKRIRFNHPFLFAIWFSELTPLPLFIGAFQKPESPF